MRTGNKFILIENPLCGNDSLGRGLKLEPYGEGKGNWETAKEVRKSFPKDKWDKLTKVILVRDPVSRFLSGCVLALNSTSEKLSKLGASESFCKSIEKAKDIESTNAVGDYILQLLATTDKSEHPTFFLPQSHWLDSKFDLVLATHNLAEYFNTQSDIRVSVTKSNLLYRNPKFANQASLSTESESTLKDLYSVDYTTFETLRVWSPNKDQVRLVSGFCATCSAKVTSNKTTRSRSKK